MLTVRGFGPKMPKPWTKHLLMLQSPRKLGVFLGEVSKRGNSFREVYDKAAVKIGEADKRLNLLDIGQGQPPANGLAESIVIPFGDTINPRNLIELV